MDLDVINADPLLDDTPIGRLRLERYGRGANAWIAVVQVPPGDYDPDTTPGRIIHTLKPGEDVFAAIYGKRFWEQRAVRERWCREQDAAEQAVDDAAREGSEVLVDALVSAAKRGAP